MLYKKPASNTSSLYQVTTINKIKEFSKNISLNNNNSLNKKHNQNKQDSLSTSSLNTISNANQYQYHHNHLNKTQFNSFTKDYKNYDLTKTIGNYNNDKADYSRRKQDSIRNEMSTIIKMIKHNKPSTTKFAFGPNRLDQIKNKTKDAPKSKEHKIREMKKILYRPLSPIANYRPEIEKVSIAYMNNEKNKQHKRIKSENERKELETFSYELSNKSNTNMIPNTAKIDLNCLSNHSKKTTTKLSRNKVGMLKKTYSEFNEAKSNNISSNHYKGVHVPKCMFMSFNK